MKKRLLIVLGVISVICMSLFNPNIKGNIEDFEGSLKTSSKNNFDSINSVFTDKVNSYSESGIYPQIYSTSLQATFYGIDTLDTLGKLSHENSSAMVNYIMSCYNETSGIFIDQYAMRYLDTDFTQIYYPLTSVLEVNSYAVLALERLGRLNLINRNKMIN